MIALLPIRSIKSLVVYASLLALCSCGHGAGNSAEIHYDRDNAEDAKLVDITDMLPAMHANTHIYMGRYTDSSRYKING